MLTLVDGPEALAKTIERARSAAAIGLDVEAAGLFAYRASLCTVQMAFYERAPLDETGGAAPGALRVNEVAIVDSLVVDCAPLAPLLGANGPLKILHDLTFDARLLQDAGITLGNVADTSVSARMLGRKATGLAALVEAEVGVRVSKELQQHDWRIRPLGPEFLEYLADDVRHLGTLYEKLLENARALGIEAEIEEECAYKLSTGLAPPRDRAPAYLRIRGADKLGEVELAALRRLVEARERIAEQADVPPFKIIGNESLLEIAKRKLASSAELVRVRGVSPRLRRDWIDSLATAVGRGIEDGNVPEGDRPPRRTLDRELVAAKRARETRLSTWRRAEAERRGVDEQAVLPGHCLQDLADLDGRDERCIAQVPGLGRARLERYGASFFGSLLRGDSAAQGDAPAPPAAATDT